MRLPFTVTAAALAEELGGVLHGPDVTIRGVAPLEDATPDDLAFYVRGEPGEGVLLARRPVEGSTTVVVGDPLLALIPLLERAFPEAPPALAPIHPSARIAADVLLHPGVVIGRNCEVGAGTVLFPNVVLYPHTRIGNDCRIHAGTVLGADGFRYHPTPTGPRKVPHVGGVLIGNCVEMGASCTVDRGFLGDTVIGDGCKFDDMVHVGHNCRLGRFVVIAAQSGLSGSCRVGDGVLIGGQVGMADHTIVGDGAKIGAQSGLHGEIPAGVPSHVCPALPIAIMRRVYGMTRFLPDMWKRFVAGG